MNFLHVYEAKTRAGLPNKHYYTTGGGTTTYYVVLHIVQSTYEPYHSFYSSAVYVLLSLLYI